LRFVRYLNANVNLLNIVLLAAIAAVFLFAILPLFRMKVRFTPPQIKPKAVQAAPVSQEESPPLSPLDYAVIGENNLFHPERRIPPLKKDEKALPRPELVLYGTIIGDGATVAYIEDKKSPKTTPGRGARQQIVKKGDVLSGFVVREIETDKIVLVRGEETMVVHLSQEKKGRAGGPAAGGQPPGRTPPGAPPRPTVGASAAPTQPNPVVQPAVKPPGKPGRRPYGE
jgi:hypothetical protein